MPGNIFKYFILFRYGRYWCFANGVGSHVIFNCSEKNDSKRRTWCAFWYWQVQGSWKIKQKGNILWNVNCEPEVEQCFLVFSGSWKFINDKVWNCLLLVLRVAVWKEIEQSASFLFEFERHNLATFCRNWKFKFLHIKNMKLSNS